MKSLKEFYADTETRDNVKAYLVQFLTEEAVKKVFNREDVGGVAEAKEIIENAFAQMELMFQPKVEKNTENESR
jgi:hypothetical protein